MIIQMQLTRWYKGMRGGCDYLYYRGTVAECNAWYAQMCMDNDLTKYEPLRLRGIAEIKEK